MRRILILVTLISAVALYLYRDRLYLWDPIARITVNNARADHFFPRDGGTLRTYINQPNDLYLDDAGHTTLLRHGMNAPAPVDLHCYLARTLCLAPADTTLLIPPAYDAHPQMSSRTITFTDAQNRSWRIDLY